MPKVKNKLLYYAHRKYGKDIIVRKEEDGILRFWTEFDAITLTLTPDGKVEEKVRKREGASAKQHFDDKAKPSADQPVKARKKSTGKNTETKVTRKKSEKVTANAKPKTPDSKPKREKAVPSKATKRCTKVTRQKLRPGDVVKSIYCDDLFTIISNEGDGIVRVAAGQVSLNDAKYHSEYLMTQYDLTELHRKRRTQ